MKCLIPAAGYATRLYPLTKDRPKALVQVADKPMMDWIIEKIDPLREVDEIFVVTNEKFYSHFKEWADAAEYDTPIQIVSDGTKSEDDRLGALGDIAFSIDRFNIHDDLMIIAGDNLFEFPVERLLERFRESRSYIVAARDIKSIELARRLGVLLVNDNGRVIDFEEKPQYPKSTLVATFMYIFPKEKLSLLSAYLNTKGAKDKAGDYLAWLHKIERLDAMVFEEPWFDIGSFDQLEEANKYFFEKKKQAMLRPGFKNGIINAH